MRTRRPAEPAYTSRTSGTMARSPSERLEPTRPPARPRGRRFDPDARKSRPLLSFLNGILTLVLFLMLLAGGVAFLFDAQIDSPGPLTKPKVVVIPKGDGTQEIAARLEREGVVSDRRIFTAGYLWTKFVVWLESGKPVQLKAGDFEVRPAMSVRQVVELLSEGKTVSYKVTVPEGLTSHQIVERLKADQNLTGEVSAVPAEGTLLPETYIVQRGSSRQAILDNMVAESRKLMERAWPQRKKDLPLKSWEEAVVLASIVEKETGRHDERERVAAVFINRLKQNMRLQSDPTILYGLHGGKVVWSRAILKSEIGQKTSHNTYQIDGLPPTPICNPGRAAIEAVLNPKDSKELYFVATGNGGHAFAETLKDHNANVVKWRAVEREIKAKAAPAAPAAPAPAASPVAAPAPGDTPAVGSGPLPNAPKSRAVIRTAPPPKAAPTTAAQKAQGAAEQPDPAASGWAPTSTPAPAATKPQR